MGRIRRPRTGQCGKTNKRQPPKRAARPTTAAAVITSNLGPSARSQVRARVRPATVGSASRVNCTDLQRDTLNPLAEAAPPRIPPTSSLQSSRLKSTDLRKHRAKTSRQKNKKKGQRQRQQQQQQQQQLKRQLHTQLHDIGEKKFGGNLKQLYRLLDTNHDGVIDAHDLKVALSIHTLGHIDPKEAFNALDRDGNGKVEFHEFCNVLKKNPAFGFGCTSLNTVQMKDLQAYKKWVPGTMKREHARVMHRLTSKAKLMNITDKSMFLPSNTTLQKHFERFDTAGDGRVSHEDFREGLRELDEGMNPEDLHLACQALDVDRQGSVDYKKWMSSLQNVEHYCPFRLNRSRMVANLQDMSKPKLLPSLATRAQGQTGGPSPSGEEDAGTTQRNPKHNSRGTLSPLLKDGGPLPSHSPIVGRLKDQPPSPAHHQGGGGGGGGVEEWGVETERAMRRTGRTQAPDPALLRAIREFKKWPNLETGRLNTGRAQLHHARLSGQTKAGRTRAVKQIFNEIAMRQEAQMPRTFDGSQNLEETSRNLGLCSYDHSHIPATSSSSGLYSSMRSASRASMGRDLLSTTQAHFLPPSTIAGRDRPPAPDKARKIARLAAKRERLKRYMHTQKSNQDRRQRAEREQLANNRMVQSIRQLRYNRYLEKSEQSQSKPWGKRSKASIILHSKTHAQKTSLFATR